MGTASVVVTVANAPPNVFIDSPSAGATVGDSVASGWAIDNFSAIGPAVGSVQVKVDVMLVGTASYGTNRPDVCAVF